ncbi:MAG: metallophosphoesterase [Verrucomicrobiales bacterium]
MSSEGIDKKQGAGAGLTRILSDLHLGHPATRVKKGRGLRPLLEGCERVIFNGDTWQERWRDRRDEGKAELDALRRLLDELGVEGVFLPGNHDPETGERTGYVSLGELGEILVTHGDGVYDVASPFSREIWHYRKEIKDLITKFPEGDRELEARLARAREIAKVIKPTPLPDLPVPLNFFATALWPPSRPVQIARAWREMPRESLAFLQKFAPAAKVLVFGHFHRAGIWEKDGRVLVNTGSFMRGGAAQIVDLQGGVMKVRAVREMNALFYPSEVKGRWQL